MKKITYKQLFEHACLEIKEITGKDLSHFLNKEIEIIQYADGGESYSTSLTFNTQIEMTLLDNSISLDWLSSITRAFLEEIEVLENIKAFAN